MADILTNPEAPKMPEPKRITFKRLPGGGANRIYVGTYIKGVTAREIEEKLTGPFGGRFEYFGSGNFQYVAYVD